MKTKSFATLIAGTGLLIAAAPAFATVVDGINVPTTSGEHVFAGTITENAVTTVGAELTGGGQVNTFDTNTDFCATPGSCSLTFQFGGYQLEQFQPAADSDSDVGNARFSGGFVNFYANGDTDNPWLTTTADLEKNSSYTLEGQLKGGGTNQAQNTAIGLLSVTGGTAADLFNNDSYTNGSGGTSDLLFNTSLSPSGDMTFTGSADAHYVSSVSEVPEPSDLAIFGLGLSLVGFGMAYRRRKQG